MTDLTERLDMMEAAIKKPGFRKSAGRANEVNYWLFDYPPENELEVRERIAHLKAENERIIQEAKIEKDNILREAREVRDRMINEAKDTAKVEGEKMIEAARHSIAMEKAAAIDDMKKQISSLSVDIAETILKKKLDNKDAQNDLVANLLNDKNLN